MRIKNHKEYQILRNDEIDLKALMQVLWAGRWSLVKITIGFFLLAIVYLIFATTLYYSNAVVVPTEDQAASSVGNLVNIASSVGMDVSQSEVSATVDLADYVSSRRLKLDLLETRWMDKREKEVDLIEYWGIDDTTGLIFRLKSGIKSLMGAEDKTDEEKRLMWLAKGSKILEKRVIARHTETGMVIVDVWMEDPVLTMSIANYVVDSMIKYTMGLKAKSWSENRIFLAKRMDEVSVELKNAEDEMTQFQNDNRRIIDSPDLSIELANLRRDVEIKTQLYISLQNQYELARMEEAKDHTGIVVLDSAFYPVEPASPKRFPVLIISIFIGTFLSVPLFLLVRGIRS